MIVCRAVHRHQAGATREQKSKNDGEVKRQRKELSILFSAGRRLNISPHLGVWGVCSSGLSHLPKPYSENDFQGLV